MRKRVGGGRCNLVSIGLVGNIHLRLTRMAYPCPRLARNRREQGRGGGMGKLGLGEPWPHDLQGCDWDRSTEAERVRPVLRDRTRS